MRTSFSQIRYFYSLNIFCKYFQRSLCIPAVSNGKRYKIIFYGTNEFSLTTLNALNQNRLCDKENIVDKLDVVCAEGMSPVRKYCDTNNLTVYNWPFIVPENQYDIGVVVSFGHLIQTKSILSCKYGMINAHPSLLPRWRGAAPISYSILHGDKESGVTILQVSPKKFDVGHILMQEKVCIPHNCTSRMLEEILGEKSSQMVLETLKDLPYFLKSSFPQPEEGVTYAKKITPEMGRIDWSLSTVVDIDRRFRAFSGYIKIYTFWKQMKVSLEDYVDPESVLDSKIDSLVNYNVAHGYCYYHKRRKNLYIKCKDGWIGISSVVIPGTGKISARDFYNGYMTKVKSDQWYFKDVANDCT